MVIIEVRYPQYPLSVSIETYCYCNANCLFCGLPNSKRERGKISTELFNKIIDEIASWDHKTVIGLSVFGEPFLNPDWLYFFKYIEKTAPLCKITVATNGSQIDDKVIDELVRFNNIDAMGFSLYAYHPDTYHDVMGLPFNTVNKIEHAVERISTENPNIPIAISYSDDPWLMSGREHELFKQKWGAYAFPHELICNHQHKNFTTRSKTRGLPCLTLFCNLPILYDGRVALCCQDAAGEVILGDVNTQSILDVWYSERYNTMRLLHANNSRATIPLCASCNYDHEFTFG